MDRIESWWKAFEAAASVGQRIAMTSDEFDRACDQITLLLQDSSLLLERNSPSTAIFLAITAIEETAKVLCGSFRKRTNRRERRQQDPLFNHKAKHKLAMTPSLSMGDRLRKAIGDAKMNELIDLADSGDLVRLREASLYIEQTANKLVTPMEVADFATGRALLLLAIEVFDDALVGYTSHSLDLGQQTTDLFEKWIRS